MIVGVKMRVLVGFLLAAALGSGLTDGQPVNKCQLRDEVMKVMTSLSEKAKQKGLTVDNLVAKIVCHAELATEFNTSAVTQLSKGMEGRPLRGRRGAHYGGLFALAEHNFPSSTIQPPNRRRRQAEQPTPDPRPPREQEEGWTLYGLFQLSNHLVCSDGFTPSPNICAMDCDKLIDDNLNDDIACLLNILHNLVEHGFGAAHWETLKTMIRLVFQEECVDQKPSEYFAECSPPPSSA